MKVEAAERPAAEPPSDPQLPAGTIAVESEEWDRLKHELESLRSTRDEVQKSSSRQSLEEELAASSTGTRADSRRVDWVAPRG